MGDKVRELEILLSNIVQSVYSVAVNSGTAALDTALKLIGVGKGDEVVIPALSYIATGNAVLYQNATPVFADIDPERYTISPDSVRQKITSKTKAVIAIDYAGQAADYDGLRDVLKGKNIYLVEDGAPGLGGKYKGKPLCSRGDVSITSFHMAKMFTSIEGGMVFTERKDWDQTAKMMRSQGENPSTKYHHPVLGHNYRMSDLHAAIGLEQIKRFEIVLNKRRKLAHRYSDTLGEVNRIHLPKVAEGNEHAWFLYPILVARRDKTAAGLREKGIETNISWPMPIYEQKIYQKYHRQECPVAKSLAQRVLCLPLYYEMTDNEHDYVVERLIEAVK